MIRKQGKKKTGGITSLLFDLDGTVLDTREFILAALEYSLAKHGYTVPERLVLSKFVGRPLYEIYGSIIGSEEVDSLLAAHREFQQANFHLSKPYPHTLETLTELRRQGFRMGIVTSRAKAGVLETMKQGGVHDLFDAVVGGDEVPFMKPDPGHVMKALELIGSEPARALMIGDSHIDVEAGNNAGVRTVRGTYGFNTEQLHDPEPDFFIEDIKDLLNILRKNGEQ